MRIKQKNLMIITKKQKIGEVKVFRLILITIDIDEDWD